MENPGGRSQVSDCRRFYYINKHLPRLIEYKTKLSGRGAALDHVYTQPQTINIYKQIMNYIMAGQILLAAAGTWNTDN